MLELEEYTPDLGVLVESGMMAIKQGDEESAKKLFNAIGLLEPGKSTKEIGYGLISLHKLDIPGAEKCFTGVIKKEPKNGRAKAFLSFTHMLAVMEENNNQKRLEHLKAAEKFAKEALELSEEESTKQLAQSVLDWEAELQDLEMPS